MRIVSVSLVLFSWAFFVISCSRPLPRIEELPLPDPKFLTAKLAQNWEELRDFSGKGILKTRSPEGKSALGVRLHYLKPDHFSMTLFGAMGIEVGRIILAADRYQVTSSSAGMNVSGDVDDFSWPGFFEVDLEGFQLLDLCQPLVCPPDRRDSVQVDQEVAAQLYRITWSDNSHVRRLWLRSFLPVATRDLLLTAQGDTIWYREFDDVKKRRGVYFPFTWHFRIGHRVRPDESLRNSVYEIQMDFSILKINQNLSPADFVISHLSQPDTVEVAFETHTPFTR